MCTVPKLVYQSVFAAKEIFFVIYFHMVRYGTKMNTGPNINRRAGSSRYSTNSLKQVKLVLYHLPRREHVAESVNSSGAP